MSTVEIIEEYRALWAQAQQEAQFAQASGRSNPGVSAMHNRTGSNR